VNPIDRETVFSDGGWRASGHAPDASRWRPGWREAAVFLALLVIGFVLWFAASPGVASVLFGVDLGLWSPNLPFVSVALMSGFVFPRGFSTSGGSGWPCMRRLPKGCPST